MGIRVRVKSNVKAVQRKAKRAVQDAVSTAALDALRISIDEVDRQDIIDTGALKASGHVRTPRYSGYRAARSSAIAYAGGSEQVAFQERPVNAGDTFAIISYLVHYAIYIEMGHMQVLPGGMPIGFVPARPFIRPAVDQVMEDMPKYIRRSFDKRGIG